MKNINLKKMNKQPVFEKGKLIGDTPFMRVHNYRMTDEERMQYRKLFVYHLLPPGGYGQNVFDKLAEEKKLIEAFKQKMLTKYTDPASGEVSSI